MKLREKSTSTSNRQDRSVARDVIAGAAAGVVGTLAMDVMRYADRSAAAQDQAFREWEIVDPDSFDEAGEPAEFAQAATDLVAVDLPDDQAALTTNLVHWGTGITWGVIHGITKRSGTVRGGILTGLSAFATSYVVLGALGIRSDFDDYDSDDVAKDAAGHLLFGLATAAAWRTARTTLLSDPEPEPDILGDIRSFLSEHVRDIDLTAVDVAKAAAQAKAASEAAQLAASKAAGYVSEHSAPAVQTLRERVPNVADQIRDRIRRAVTS